MQGQGEEKQSTGAPQLVLASFRQAISAQRRQACTRHPTSYPQYRIRPWAPTYYATTSQCVVEERFALAMSCTADGMFPNAWIPQVYRSRIAADARPFKEAGRKHLITDQTTLIRALCMATEAAATGDARPLVSKTGGDRKEIQSQLVALPIRHAHTSPGFWLLPAQLGLYAESPESCATCKATGIEWDQLASLSQDDLYLRLSRLLLHARAESLPDGGGSSTASSCEKQATEPAQNAPQPVSIACCPHATGMLWWALLSGRIDYDVANGAEFSQKFRRASSREILSAATHDGTVLSGQVDRASVGWIFAEIACQALCHACWEYGNFELSLLAQPALPYYHGMPDVLFTQCTAATPTRPSREGVQILARPADYSTIALVDGTILKGTPIEPWPLATLIAHAACGDDFSTSLEQLPEFAALQLEVCSPTSCIVTKHSRDSIPCNAATASVAGLCRDILGLGRGGLNVAINPFIPVPGWFDRARAYDTAQTLLQCCATCNDMQCLVEAYWPSFRDDVWDAIGVLPIAADVVNIHPEGEVAFQAQVRKTIQERLTAVALAASAAGHNEIFARCLANTPSQEAIPVHAPSVDDIVTAFPAYHPPHGDKCHLIEKHDTDLSFLGIW